MKAMVIGAAVLMASLASASPAAAQASAMKDCAAKYQAAKTAKTLPAGQTWMQYLAQCRAAAKPAAPVAATATRTAAAHTVATSTVTRTNASVAAGQRSPAQVAEVSRQKQCGAQWKVDKAAGKTGALTWPQYWSACSKRLKGA